MPGLLLVRVARAGGRMLGDDREFRCVVEGFAREEWSGVGMGLVTLVQQTLYIFQAKLILPLPSVSHPMAETENDMPE